MNKANTLAQVTPKITKSGILFYITGVDIKYPSATNKATNISNI